MSDLLSLLSLTPGALINGDALALLTVKFSFASDQGLEGQNQIELMMPAYGPLGDTARAWFLDGASSGGIDGIIGQRDTTSGVTNTTFYGMSAHCGQVMSVYAGGTYVGDYIVGTDGSVACGTKLAFLFDWTDGGPYEGGIPAWGSSSTKIVVTTNGNTVVSSFYAPVIIGFKYGSTGQLLRPNSAADAKTPSGPAIAKQRRFNMIGAHVQNTTEFNVAIGTEGYNTITQTNSAGIPFLATQFTYQFGTFKPVPIVYPNGTPYVGNLDYPGALDTSHALPFNGILWSPVDDDYTFDGMIAWQVSDPYPCRVLSLGGFFQTQER